MRVRFDVRGRDRFEVEAKAYTQARDALGEEPVRCEVVEMRPLVYRFGREEPDMWDAEVEAESASEEE